MADILIAEQSMPAAPAAGNLVMYADSTASLVSFRDDSGRVQAFSMNSAVASQGAGFAADTYVTNSDLLIPSCGFQAKAQIVWRISASKTAAGTAAPVYSIRIGANRTTADTARLTLTGPAQTAAIDDGILTVMVTVRSVGAAGVIQGTAAWVHELGTATGFGGNVEGTSAGFDNSALAGQYIGLSINGGTSAAWTVTQVQAEASW